MEKIKAFVNKNYKVVIGIIIGITISVGIGVSAVATKDITYDNSTSGLTSTNMQGAIDEISEKIKPCKVTKGTGEDIGDEITCGSESFYVVSADASKTSMFAKYNIETGKNFYFDNNNLASKEITYAKNIQNGQCDGYGGYFKGTKYDIATCVTLENNSIYYPSTDTSMYLEYFTEQLKINKDDVTISIPTKELLESFGCTFTRDNGAPCYQGSCSSAPYWIYSSSYFISDGVNNMSIITPLGGVSCSTYPLGKSLRPVVTISSNKIQY